MRDKQSNIHSISDLKLGRVRPDVATWLVGGDCLELSLDGREPRVGVDLVHHLAVLLKLGQVHLLLYAGAGIRDGSIDEDV